MRNPLLALFATALAGCATTGSAPPPAGPSGGACSDSGVTSYIGQPYSDALGAEMRSKSGAQSLRKVGYGEVVTMEFNANRLTVSLDEQNKVATARCG